MRIKNKITVCLAKFLLLFYTNIFSTEQLQITVLTQSGHLQQNAMELVIVDMELQFTQNFQTIMCFARTFK